MSLLYGISYGLELVTQTFSFRGETQRKHVNNNLIGVLKRDVISLVEKSITLTQTYLKNKKLKNLAFEKNVNNKRKGVWHEVYTLFEFYILIIKCLFFLLMINQLSRLCDMELFFLFSCFHAFVIMTKIKNTYFSYWLI